METQSFTLNGKTYNATRETDNDYVITDASGVFVRRILSADSLASAIESATASLTQRDADANATFASWNMVSPYAPNGSRLAVAKWNTPNGSRFSVHKETGGKWHPVCVLMNEMQAFKIYLVTGVELFKLEHNFSDDE